MPAIYATYTTSENKILYYLAVNMSNAIAIDSIQPLFDSSCTKLAWATADGKVRICHARGPSRTKDITQELADSGTTKGLNLTKSHVIYSSLQWGQKVRNQVTGLRDCLLLFA